MYTISKFYMSGYNSTYFCRENLFCVNSNSVIELLFIIIFADVLFCLHSLKFLDKIKKVPFLG